MLSTLILLAALLAPPAALQNSPEMGQQETSSKVWMDLVPGTLPLVISVPHGGVEHPEGWVVREDGVLLRDTNTAQIAQALVEAIRLRTGQRPFLIASRVHREHLDLNRGEMQLGSLLGPNQGHLWREYHAQIEAASVAALELGKGQALLLDIHGHAHEHGLIELGFAVSAKDLRKSDQQLADADWIRGPGSLGARLQTRGWDCVPSPSRPAPEIGQKYFNGGHTVRRHRGGGLRSIQIELPPQPRRSAAPARQALVDDLADAVLDLLAEEFLIPPISMQTQASATAVIFAPANFPWSKAKQRSTACFAKELPKLIDVFGIPVLATDRVPLPKHAHAAAMIAEYLDNDEDGFVDDPQVLRHLQASGAFLVVPETERQMEKIMPQFDAYATAGWDLAQDLYAEEIHPSGAPHQNVPGPFDASIEECWHLVSNGWAMAYPQAFSTDPDSKSRLTKAMDVARGGHFLRIPRQYPSGAWFRYYDGTCSYSCMAMEYWYWGLSSMLGCQDYPGRAGQIAHEWRLTTAEQFRTKDVELHTLLTDAEFALPTVAPDGVYRVVD